MKSSKTKFVQLRIIGSAVGLALFGMLATQGASAGQQDLAVSLAITRTNVVQARDQLQKTVDSLEALVKQKSGDIRPAYDAFVAEIAKTQAAGESAKACAQKMEADASTHFGSWQKEVDGIANPSLKKKAQKRLTDVQKQYEKVGSQLKEAASRFTPLLSDLNDIQKTLANDLTPGGVKSVRGSVSDAKWNLTSARRYCYSAIEGLTKMEKSLGTTVPD